MPRLAPVARRGAPTDRGGARLARPPCGRREGRPRWRASTSEAGRASTSAGGGPGGEAWPTGPPSSAPGRPAVRRARRPRLQRAGGEAW